jgi:general secretion pathway protein H
MQVSFGSAGKSSAADFVRMIEKPRPPVTPVRAGVQCVRCGRNDTGSSGDASVHPVRGAQGGFTLIEVLVVIVIVAVLVAALTLAVGGTSARQLDASGERFQALLEQACRQAQLSGREIGVVMAGDGYTFTRLDGDQWRAFDTGGELRPRRWPEGLRIELNRDGEPLALATPKHQRPQLVCFSSGELTAFSLVLALGDAPRFRITGADDGHLSSDHIAVPR